MPRSVTTKKTMTKARKPTVFRAATKQRFDPLTLQSMENVLAYEGGNGKAGLAFVSAKGEIVRRIMPHARARTSGERTSRDGAVFRAPYMEFEGSRWEYSDSIFMLNKPIDTFQGSEERYGTSEHLFPLMVMMADEGLPSGRYKLAVTIPPGYYDDSREEVVKRIKGGSQGSGVWTITNEDGETFQYAFEDVAVLMEAADSGYAAARYDERGDLVMLPGEDGQDMLGGMLRIGDAGFGTFDFPTMKDGALIEDRLKSSTDSRGGIGAIVVAPIMDDITRRLPQVASWLQPAHVDFWLRRWANGYVDSDGKKHAAWKDEAAVVRVINNTLHLGPSFNAHADEYANYLYRQVVRAQSEAVDTFMAIGGGWLYAYEKVVSRLAHSKIVTKLISHRDVPHLKGYNWFEINLCGLLTAAMIVFGGE